MILAKAHLAAQRTGLVCLLLGNLTVGSSGVAGSRDDALYDRAENSKEEPIQLLEHLVNIDSDTGQKEGLDRVVGILTNELGRLGASIDLLPRLPEIMWWRHSPVLAKGRYCSSLI
jgi:glutamate carboxypeptidase